MLAGVSYTHPEFKDVYFHVIKSSYVPEKKIYQLMVSWIKRKHGFVIAEEKITITAEKAKEFIRKK